MQGNSHLLEIKELSKVYGKRRVVDRVDLQVRAGEVVGLLGPNGAGKTTTFYMIIGFVRPNEGKILLDGEDISALPIHLRAKRGITYLPQEPSVFRKLTVKENIMAILETMDIPPQERQRRLEGLLEELNLSHLANNKAYSLSGGERRRVEITRALVLEPRFILLDEPFSGIDPIAVVEIQKIIQRLKEKGIGVILSDHNVRETLHVCDRAYILNDGHILEEGSPGKIARSRKVRKIYLGEDFQWRARTTRRRKGKKGGA